MTSEDGLPPQAATVRAEIHPQTPIPHFAGLGPPADSTTTLLAAALQVAFGPLSRFKIPARRRPTDGRKIAKPRSLEEKAGSQPCLGSNGSGPRDQRQFRPQTEVTWPTQRLSQLLLQQYESTAQI